MAGALLVGVLALPAFWVGHVSVGQQRRSGAAQAATVAVDYRATCLQSLFQGATNLGGGATGGFGDDLKPADFAYRLGSASDPVPEAELDDLLVEHRGQIGLTGDHQSALRRALGERTAFAAWKQFFADGGRVRPYSPVKPEDLHEIPPSQLVLVGQGRYMPDRLVIVSSPDEPAMEEFLFHEIQHYILDKWDSSLFEAGAGQNADHKVIEILDERRRIVETVRSGRIPMTPRLPRILQVPDGTATDSLRAGRWAEAVERAQSETFYQAWVTAALQGVLAKNESNHRIRMISMRLSNGKTLLFDERSDRDSPDDVRAMDARVPPRYRFGPVIYASLEDIRRFDVDRLFSEGYVPQGDRPAVWEFVLAHRRDWRKGRGHIFSDRELQDLAHLHAYNAAIFQQALRLAVALQKGTERALDEVMEDERYQAAFSEFLRRYAHRMAEGPSVDPRAAAAGIADDVTRKLPALF